jgi:dolichyl-phosphate beta-glucosyltransferase
MTIETIIAIGATFLATAGLTWIFFPALTAGSHALEWDETKLSENTDTPTALLSLVVPAYNEEDRIPTMIQAAHDYLQSPAGSKLSQRLAKCSKLAGKKDTNNANANHQVEWVFVNDGSWDGTCRVIRLAHEQCKALCHKKEQPPHIWRLLSLKANSGKGAAVKTGMLQASGHYRLMVDADGATEFGTGLEHLVTRLEQSLEQHPTSPVAIFGSRAHLQSAAKRSLVRTLLMHAFHFFVSILVSTQIQDTQCGFKLFTQEAAESCFNKLHLRRWAFDTELLVRLRLQHISVEEVGVPWQEIDGSKLATSKFALAWVSLSMLRDMICVRACYSLGIWSVQR